jgi:UDP-N-acetylmuramate dehydrogenase
MGVPVFVLGSGANILVGDGGVRGLVVWNRARGIRWDGAGLVEAESGTSIAVLLRQAVRRGWSGLEHFAGIPSTLGGALRQNLHFLSPAPERARTVYLAEVVVDCVVTTGVERMTLDRAALGLGYDESRFHHTDEVVLAARLRLTPDAPDALRRVVRENLAWRRDRHPPFRRLGNAGSIFKKVAGIGAGRLIDQVGLKGRRVGDAEVSPLHANFIVNHGQATAAEVRSLIALVQQEVVQATGHRLDPEIGFIGRFPDLLSDRAKRSASGAPYESWPDHAR